MSSFKEVYNKLGELAEAVSGRVVQDDELEVGWYEGFQETRTGTGYTYPFSTLIPTLHNWEENTLSYYPASLLDPMKVGYTVYKLSNFLSWGAQQSETLDISIINTGTVQIQVLFEITFYTDDGYGRSSEWISRSQTVEGKASTSISCTVPPDTYDWKVTLLGVYING